MKLDIRHLSDEVFACLNYFGPLEIEDIVKKINMRDWDKEITLPQVLTRCEYLVKKDRITYATGFINGYKIRGEIE